MKATQGCRTCKKRKIGCDKQLPSCQNCVRTRRHCLGYGLQLVWPDQHDGRRKSGQVILPTHAVDLLLSSPEIFYGQHFLNTSHKDLESALRPTTVLRLNSERRKCTACSAPRSISPWPSDMFGDAANLLLYYECRISSMISTIDTKNGFRIELLPRALSQSCGASTALLNAILAVSCFHRFGMQAALPFKTKALRYLCKSLASEQTPENLGVANTQLATSLMLCVYSVFDETEENWHIHLRGAKYILQRLSSAKYRNTTSSFLFTWYLYHEVLGGFSRFCSPLADEKSLVLDLFSDSSSSSEIVGSLGCSLELLHIIRDINLLRDGLHIPRYAEKLKKLESQLLLISQHAEIIEDYRSEAAERQKVKILNTAEFYRVAALIYLLRIDAESRTIGRISIYIQQAFRILEALPICTSPWPLFVLACEVETDRQRIAILHALDRMDQDRKIGNVFVLRNIIESLWKRRDLLADTGSRSVFQWWNPAMWNTTTPWFI